LLANAQVEKEWTMKKAKRILVGLKTLEHAVELADLACRAGVHQGSLLLVHVIEIPDVTPLDADLPDLEALAQKILRAAERVTKGSRMKVRKLVMRAHWAGAALIETLKEENIDLAVLGYHHGRSLGEILLGTTAQHVAKHAPCHVLLSIPPRT
jgi:nucleotide-binding universal stress UspA family protein